MTPQKLTELLDQSGYPFELRVCDALAKAGFSVQPSHHFFDAEAGKDREIDIVATENSRVRLGSGATGLAILRIGVSCKDNSHPYVCFGFDAPEPPGQGYVDQDAVYCHVSTSRDNRIPQRFSYPVLDSEGDVRSSHHYFTGEFRHHLLAGVRLVGKGDQQRLKLDSPEALTYVLGKLGSFIASSQGYAEPEGSRLSKEMETFTSVAGPALVHCFAMLVHSGDHYEYSLGSPEIKRCGHTPVFQGRTYLGRKISYVVDVVSEDALPDALATVRSTHNRVVNQIFPWIANSG